MPDDALPAASPNGSPPAAPRGRLRLWLLIFPFVLLVPVVLMPTLLSLFGGPVFPSVDDVDPAAVEAVRVHVLMNRGGGDDTDIGPYQADPADFDRLVALLRGAERRDRLPPKTWLGDFRVKLNGQRTQQIKLSWLPDDPDKANPPVAFLIEGNAFVAKARLADVVRVARECEGRGVKK